MNKKNVPEIRFSGFDDEWKNNTLENLIDYSGSGGTPLSTNKNYYGREIPFLSITDITLSGNYIYKTQNWITNLGLKNSSAWIVPKESISLAMYASVGKVAILKTDLATSQAFFNMVIGNVNLKYFIFQYLKLMEYKNGWTQYISTGTQQNLNAEKVKNLNIKLPNYENELKKIGTFLKNIDDLIINTEKQCNHYKNIKDTLLNKMFPANYSNIPDIRFKGFEENWNAERLGNIGTFRSAGVDKIFRDSDNFVYMINFMDVYNKKTINAHNYKTLMKTTATIQEYHNCNLIKGDILITPSSETVEDIGMPLTIKETLKNVVYSYHLMRFRPNSGFFNIYFSDYVLTSEFVRSQMLYKAQGVQRIVLNKPDFENLNIKLPSSMHEQTKIGKLFKNIDDLITLTKKKHEKLKNIKNALLNKMFC